MEKKLLQLCTYSEDAKSLDLVRRVKKNYSDFDGVVKALEDLKPILAHSSFYLSLLSERDMIKIKSDAFTDDDDMMMLDSEIIVWANEHNIELEEGFDKICILGFKHQE